MESTETVERPYKSRRIRTVSYEDKWEKDWKDILPTAPEKPSDETGVWRLTDTASDWKDISENIAKIPKLRRHRPRPSETDHKICSNADEIRNLYLLCKNQKTSHFTRPDKKRLSSLIQEKTAKVTMIDKSVQTDDDDELLQNILISRASYAFEKYCFFS